MTTDKKQNQVNSQDSTKKIITKEHFKEHIKEHGKVIHQDLRESGIPDRYLEFSFSNFIANTKGMEEILQTCIDFANGKYSSLILAGKNGTGKTMLACCILKFCIIYDLRENSQVIYFQTFKRLYTEAIKLVRQIKLSWKHPDPEYNEQKALNRYTYPELLVIDEIGMQYGSQTESQFITEIINDRYNQQNRTILAGNVSVQEIEEMLGSRVVDRFRQNGKVLIFDWDSYRSKKKE